MGQVGQTQAVSSYPRETVEDPLVIRLEGSQSIQGCEFRNTDLMHEDVTMVAQGLLGCSTDLDLGRVSSWT